MHTSVLIRLAVPVMLALPCVASAQAPTPLPLKREPPIVAWEGCPPAAVPPAPTDSARSEAARLTAAANESAILGDNAAAVALLAQAAALDPREGRVAYLRARTLDLLGRSDEALAEYCRYAALVPDSADRPDVEDRIAELAGSRGFTVSAGAARYHATALARFDDGQPQLALAVLDSAVTAAPEWANALYNRGVVKLALGHTDAAEADLRHYLRLSPGAADFDIVLDVLGRPQAAPAYSPGAALAAGLVVPGLGHFTTGRPGRGAVFLGSAAAMIGGGLLATTTRVECLSPAVDGHCPAADVLRETTERPALVPALIGAAVTGVVGAIDAYRGARRANDATSPDNSADAGVGFSVLPANAGSAVGHVTLLRLRF
jgi:tetratricopeptide (TPR) repeat protein